ncbi:MAG TPA: MFS transporter [Pseudonocardiaceae bacterium]|jgi:MHS family proline/betaine transporter-like MFS transporter|nr:MFS transporter [Pseudonocardiaceae bacterium]
MNDQETGTPEPDLSTVRRAVAASAMGNCIEWFDFGVYSAGAITATIGRVFFPTHSSSAAVLASFAVLAGAFVVRPFGGLVFGPLGDKYGRQRVLATTIILMSASTFVIGVLPTYTTIGVFAPILLVLARMVQGFSTGGEYGGAATFMCEYAPDGKRGFFGSWLEFGTLSGFVLGSGLVLIIDAAVSQSAMDSWGWRIPFLVALPLGLVGLYLRTKLEDTPAFTAMSKSGNVAKSPLKETILGNWRMILNLIGIVFLLNVADYTVLTFMPTFMNTDLHIANNTAQIITISVEIVMMVVITFIGRLSDRVGRKPILLTAAIGYAVLGYPAIALMIAGGTVRLVIGFAILGALLVLILAVIGSTFPAMFPTRVRYGSFAIGYNVSTSAFGGTAPFVITALITATGTNLIPAFYLILAGLVGIVPILLIPETAHVSLRGLSPTVTPGLGRSRLRTAAAIK